MYTDYDAVDREGKDVTVLKARLAHSPFACTSLPCSARVPSHNVFQALFRDASSAPRSTHTQPCRPARRSPPPSHPKTVGRRPRLGLGRPMERGLPRCPRWYLTLTLTHSLLTVHPHIGMTPGTIVATLMTPIGSHFQKSNQASYIGTSYLLSVCCFTPLYGECISPPRAQSTHIRSGRLSDILGRRGAMLLALTLFGTCTSTSPEPMIDLLASLKAWVQSYVVWRPPWRLSSRLVQ